MTWTSLGSLALPNQLHRHSVALRTDLARHSGEMTTGQSLTPAARLKGDLSALAAVAARSQRVGRALDVTRQGLTHAATGQIALGKVAQTLADLSARALAVSSAGIDDSAVRSAGLAARGALDDVIAALGVDVSGRALFSGIATDRQPLVSADAMLTTLSGAVAAATSAAEVATIVDSAFLDPGGAFETTFYLGSAPGPGGVLDTEQTVPPLPTADHPAIRRSLAGLVKAALLADGALILATNERQALARNAALTLSGAGAGLNTVQAALGDSEARLDDTLARLVGERDALTLARDALTGVDPYEAATQLEATQARLELLYTITARTARLSLAGYL